MMMNKLRRSFRESFRRRRDKVSQSDNVHQWQSDEMGVRQGHCSFPVKYLGCVEVFESRGMSICEEALKVLRTTKKKAVRGTLFVTGDELRVVDLGETRGLIVDQTIDKVSFCAPDRNHDRGFAYICRDGTTRRWMCHGFHAIKNSGERLSHAVGFAFTICLERKLKRDKEAAELASSNNSISTHNHSQIKKHPNQIIHSATSINADTSKTFIEPMVDNAHSKPQFNSSNSKSPEPVKNSNFVRSCSFRQTSITDRRNDPQTCKLTEPPPIKAVINPYAIDRPHATPLMLQRQTSFRPLSNLKSQSPFKRQLSLKLSQPQQIISRQTNIHQFDPTLFAQSLPPFASNNQQALMPTPRQQINFTHL